eukprot:4289414-Amphidinium_carterae.1
MQASNGPKNTRCHKGPNSQHWTLLLNVCCCSIEVTELRYRIYGNLFEEHRVLGNLNDHAVQCFEWLGTVVNNHSNMMPRGGRSSNISQSCLWFYYGLPDKVVVLPHVLRI